jgi:hypothetical protein
VSPVRVAIVRFQEIRVHCRADRRGVAELVGDKSGQLLHYIASQLPVHEHGIGKVAVWVPVVALPAECLLRIAGITQIARTLQAFSRDRTRILGIIPL